MSMFISFAMCIIMVIYLSMVSAAPPLLPAFGIDMRRLLMKANNHSMPTKTAGHQCVTCPDHASNEPTCPLNTYRQLLKNLISNSDLIKPKGKVRDDYLFTPNIGLHKLHTRSTPWHIGRRICREEGGHLAIINSQDEARVLSEMLRQAGNIKDAGQPNIANVGIHTYFANMEWVTVLDDSLTATGFNKWSDLWGGQPDNLVNEKCGTYVLDDEGLADVNCDINLPFFCELPIENN